MVAATATSTTEKRSQGCVVPALLRSGSGSWERPPSLLLWPPGQRSGAPRALREPSFIPTVRSAPEWAYAFTGSCVVGRSRALPPIGDSHPCPEDRLLR